MTTENKKKYQSMSEIGCCLYLVYVIHIYKPSSTVTFQINIENFNVRNPRLFIVWSILQYLLP